MNLRLTPLLRCFQCVKGNKFESDSQHSRERKAYKECCFQCVKGNKFESDSQQVCRRMLFHLLLIELYRIETRLVLQDSADYDDFDE